MQQFHFRVVSEPDENAKVPAKVAGHIIADVEELLKATGEMMLRLELRTQSKFPYEFLDRLTLNLSGSDTKVSANSMEDRQFLELVLSQVCSELDRAATYSEENENSSNFVGLLGKKKIAAAILKLAEDLEGYKLLYGVNGNLRRLEMGNTNGLLKIANIDIKEFNGAAIGVLNKTARSYAARFTNGIDDVEAVFAKNVEATPECYRAAMIVTGDLDIDSDGKIAGITDVTSCTPFRNIMFHRIFTADKDLCLMVPALAVISYDANKNLWNLSNKDLGINVSKPSWDDAVLAYHEYFMFLWDTYVGDDEFEGEEKDISDLLRSMAFP